MKHITWRLTTFVALALPFFLIGCVKPFMVACQETARAEPYGYTEAAGANQVGTACGKAQYYAFPKNIKKDEEKNPYVNFNGMQTEHVAETIGKQLKDLNLILSYENERFSKHVDWLRGLRPALEHEERVRSEALRRLTAASVYASFVKKVGKPPQGELHDDVAKYYFPDGPEYYTMGLFHDKPGLTLGDVPFTATYLNRAKEDGRLELVDSYEFFEDVTYDEKEPDLRDPNKFTWKQKKHGWAIYGYNITTEGIPQDNTIEYLEIFRKKEDGEVEASPAVRGFLPQGGSTVSAFLIDYHKDGEIGFGDPDEFWTTYTTLKNTGMILENSTLRSKLVTGIFKKPAVFVDTERPERRKPDAPLLYAEIVPFGQDIDIDLWRLGTWSVPFEYDKMTKGMEIKFVPPMSVEEKESDLKKIKLFVRTFKNGSEKVVIEYWEPKEEFTGRDYALASAYSDVINLRPKGGVHISAELSHYSEKLTALDYRFGGRWYRIKDEDGDGVFEKKREIAEPTGDGSGIGGGYHHGEYDE